MFDIAGNQTFRACRQGHFKEGGVTSIRNHSHKRRCRDNHAGVSHMIEQRRNQFGTLKRTMARADPGLEVE